MEFNKTINAYKSLFEAVTNWVVPPQIKKIGLLYRRARIMTGSILILTLWTPLSVSTLYFLSSPFHLTILPVIGVSTSLLALILLRYTGSYTLAVNIVMFALVGTIADLSYHSGGLSSPSLLIMGCFPILSVYIADFATNIIWMGIMLTFIIVCYILKLLQMDFPQIPAFAHDVYLLVSLVILITSSFIIAIVHERIRSRLEQDLEDRAKQLAKMNQTILEQEKTLVYTSKMAALGEMAGGVAHEINTPLAIIKATAEQLMDETQEEKSPLAPYGASLERIVVTTERISKIVKGLLTFARGGNTVPHISTPVAKIIADTLEFCHEKLLKDSVSLTIEQSNPALVVRCQPLEISQVLLNLINNAADAVKFLTEKWIKIRVECIQPHVLISIIDSGKGIPPAIAEKLFQPFFTTKEIGQGTGIGLSIAQGLIKNHNGEIYLDPQCPNTCFVIKLPAIT